MSQRIPQSGQEMLSLPDFHDDGDLFDDEDATLVAHPRRRRVLIFLAIIMLAGLVIGCVLLIMYRTHIVYQTKRVVQNDLVITVHAPGSLHTNVYTVNFMGSGKLAAINITLGQPIKKDQILAKLDPTSLQNALNEAQINVQVAQTALDNANANYVAVLAASQSSNAAPVTASISAGSGTHTKLLVIPQSAARDKVQVIEARGQVKATQKALALALAKLDTANYNMSNVILRAPHDGTIATLNGVVGGEPGATFIQIVDPASLQVQANVRESDIGAVAMGDAVSFSIDAYPGQSFNGNVMTISPLGQSISGVVTYPVWITIVSAVPVSIHLLPDMTAHVTITTKVLTNVLLLPVSALTFAQAAEKPRAELANQSMIEHGQIHTAFDRANEMVQKQQQDVLQDNPAPAVVLERSAYDKIIAVPIVVGLTDGSEYEVLDGLSVNDVVLVGAQASSN